MYSDTHAIDEYLRMFDHILDEREFGNDNWHSLLWNLQNVRQQDWTTPPPGGVRTIRQLAWHIGTSFLMFENEVFGDNTRAWDDDVVDGVGPGETQAEMVSWLRLAHAKLRTAFAGLTDEQLLEERPAWGGTYPLRRIIEVMIQHPIYHTGEINHIRAVLQGNDDWGNDDIGRQVTEDE